MPLLISSQIPSLFVPKTTAINSHRSRRRRSRHGRCLIARATTEREGSQQFEVDQDKARKALRELDEKLLSLSQQESLSAKRPSPSFLEPTLDRDQITGLRTDEMPDMPDSFFAYTAAGLLFLTIFYNILFSSFIKPSIDGNEVVTKIERVALGDPSEQQPPQLSGPR